MGRAFHVRLNTAAAAALVALVAISACTVHQTDTPGLAGPSEFATSIEITATPDHVRQDGVSQSSVVVRARDANGQPIAAMGMRFAMSVGGTVQDFGTLSARNGVTGSDGRASVMYTAPAAPPAGSGGSGTTIEIVANSVGTNSQNSQSQSVSIDLVPPGVILAPAGAPTATFVVTPTPVNVGVAATFDASSSLPGTNATQLTYSWSFGDGDTGSGRIVRHAFSSAGTFSVTLTVTNERGFSASTTQSVAAAVTQAPTADFVFSPALPAPLTNIQFNAQTSAAGPGRTIVQYLWNWGDGESASGITQDHDYAAPGTYNVVLTVVDDLGQRATVSKPVGVGVVGGPNGIR